MLTDRSLSSVHQLQIIVDAADLDNLPVIPVSTPNFKFPTECYRESNLMTAYPTALADEIWLRVQKMFKKISVSFATHASHQILGAQAAEVLARIPPVEFRVRQFPLRASSDLSAMAITAYRESRLDSSLSPVGIADF